VATAHGDPPETDKQLVESLGKENGPGSTLGQHTENPWENMGKPACFIGKTTL